MVFVYSSGNDILGIITFYSYKTTFEKLEKAGFKQARPDDKLFEQKKDLMIFTVKCTFPQIVLALQNVLITFKPYKNHLWKAGKGRIWTS